jgi:hypothetical protein
VIAERQIRRLKSQVKTERAKSLTGRPKKKLEDELYPHRRNGGRSSLNMSDEMFDAADLDYSHFPGEETSTQQRRLCKQMEKSRLYQDAEVNKIGAEKLLEASLLSLETIGRQKSKNEILKNISKMHSSHLHHRHSEEPDSEAESMDGKGAERENKLRNEGGDDSVYPNISYLRGALWLGRNMTLLSEELIEELESYRLKFLNEINEITKDNDFKRACSRYYVLSTAGINHTLIVANKTKEKTREILEVRKRKNLFEYFGLCLFCFLLIV